MKSGFGHLLSLFVSDSKKWYALYNIMPSQYLPTPQHEQDQEDSVSEVV
jgi:hypothetical protein